MRAPCARLAGAGNDAIADVQIEGGRHGRTEGDDFGETFVAGNGGEGGFVRVFACERISQWRCVTLRGGERIVCTLNCVDIGRIDGGQQHFDEHFGVFGSDQRLLVTLEHLQWITVLGVPEH